MASSLVAPAVLAISLLVPVVASRKTTNPTRVPKNAILLSKVSSITLRKGKLTSSRRVDPVPQLECVGPKEICQLYNVDVMRCTNDGADYEEENIQWSCKASLPEEFKLGSTDVVCEGYESSDDPYVLKGSCAVEYRLLLTGKGEEKYNHDGRLGGGENYSGEPEMSGTESRIPGLVFGLIFVAILFVILRGMWNRWNGNPPRLGGDHRPNGGDGGDDDPPPPYDGPPNYSSPKKQSTRSASTRASASRSQPRSSSAGGDQQQGAWRPGFWTGALTGAAGGYTANVLLQNRNQTRQQQQPLMQERPRTNWFSNPQPNPNPDYGAPSSSFSRPSPSSERHESTGFGGTRRR